MREQLDDYSIREKNLWFEYLTDIAVALYYWPNAIRLMTSGDEALRGGQMIGLITSTVIVAIVVSVGLSIFLHAQRKPEPMDERDHIIQARAAIWSGRVLVVGIFSVMGNIVIQEMMGEAFEGRPLFALSPLLIAHLLLVVLMAASLVGTSVKLYLYRKGV